MKKLIGITILLFLVGSLIYLKKKEYQSNTFDYFSSFSSIALAQGSKCLNQEKIFKRLTFLERTDLYKNQKEQAKLNHFFKENSLAFKVIKESDLCEVQMGSFNSISFSIPVRVNCAGEIETWLVQDHNILEGFFKSEKEAREKLFNSLVREIKDLCSGKG